MGAVIDIRAVKVALKIHFVVGVKPQVCVITEKMEK